MEIIRRKPRISLKVLGKIGFVHQNEKVVRQLPYMPDISAAYVYKYHNLQCHSFNETVNTLVNTAPLMTQTRCLIP